MSAIVLLSAFGVSVGSLTASTSAKADTLQMSSDDASTGWYPNEPLLSPTSVTPSHFGELFDTTILGSVYAQPLVVQPIVLTVTEDDNAYGINSTTGSVVWSDNFGTPADPELQNSCGDVGAGLGITGTPVIDPSTHVAYFVAATDGGSGGATEFFMEAVNVLTGVRPADWPSGGVLIRGAADDDPGTIFNGNRQTERPGLVLSDGVIYAAFGSQCDKGPWEGWLAGVSENAATITTMWSSETGVVDPPTTGPGGGIWQSGSAPVVDSAGDIFVATGNGDIPSTPEPGTDTSIQNYGEAVVELHPDSSGELQVVDWFIPSTAVSLNAQDGDLGSGGPVELPASMGTAEEPSVLLEVGKQGILYALNANSLGGYEHGSGGSDAVPWEGGPFGGVWSKPAAWPGDGGYVYIPTAGTGSFVTTGGSLNVFQRMVSASGAVYFQLVGATANSGNTFGYGSGAPIVTSTGTTSGSSLVWIIHSTGPSGIGSQLEAFNPIPQNPGPDGTLQEVWSSPTFDSTVFESPGVDNGVLYVGTYDGDLLAFGSTSTPPLSGNNVNFAPTVVSQSDTLSATFTATAPTSVTSFAVEGGSYALGSPTPSLPVSLTTGQSISVPVTFTPDAIGANPGTVTATTSSGTATVTLSGEGLGATSVLGAAPDQADFVPQPINGPNVEIPITFTNQSSSAVTITGFSAPALPFSILDAPGDVTLNPYGQSGDSLSFDVVFSPPASSGDFDHVFGGVATLETSAGDFGVPVSASAEPPAQITTIPNALSFGDVDVGSSATLSFDLGDQGGIALTITQSTPPTSGGFTALTNPFVQLADTSPIDQIAGDTSIEETVEFSPVTTGSVSATWLLAGNDGSGVQTITITGTGVSPPPPPPTTPTTTPTTPVPPPVTPSLTIVTTSARAGSALSLAATGDPSGGALRFAAKDGTAKGCSVVGDKLRATGAGTCVVTATRAASGSTPNVSSSPTVVTFKPAPALATLTINFESSSDALSAADRTSLEAFTKRLTTGETIACIGYAKDDATLAKGRASSVASYISARVAVHVSLRAITNAALSMTVVTVI